MQKQFDHVSITIPGINRDIRWLDRYGASSSAVDEPQFDSGFCDANIDIQALVIPDSLVEDFNQVSTPCRHELWLGTSDKQRHRCQRCG